MPAPTPRPDHEGQYPSPYRGVTKIRTPPPGYKKYVLYNAEGGYMGEVMLGERYATPETEALILEIQQMNDPEEVEDQRPLLRLEA